jgi:hypothetical protein
MAGEVFSSVGAQYVFWGYRDGNGYVTGTSASLANGANSGMGRLLGVNQAGIQKSPARDIVIPGDNGFLAAIKIPPGDVAKGTIVANMTNPVFASGVQSLLIDALGSSDIPIDGVPCPTYRQIVTVVNSPAQDSNGNAGWAIRIYLNLQVDPVDGDTQDANPNNVTYNLLASYATKFPWGKALSAVTNGSTKALVVPPFFSLYPLTIHTFKGDAAITTLVLNETPAGASSLLVPYFKDGTIQVYTTNYTVVTATKTVTFVAAPGAGTLNVLPYFFVPTC